MADSHEQFERWSDMFRREREKVESLRAELAAARERAIPEELFDGYAVWVELGDAREQTTGGDVSAVLDAVVRLIRRRLAAPTSAAHTGEG